MVVLCRKYGVLQDGNRFLELVTGWLHWFGLYTRLHAEIRVDLYDVWDNRQFDAMNACFDRLVAIWDERGRTTKRQSELLETIRSSASHQDLYDALNVHYRIDPNGSLSGYEDGSFNCVFSFHVLEHIDNADILNSINDMFRILKPGAYCIHQIGIDDHLTHYDKSQSPKNYLRFSHLTWNLMFKNIVQYHNLLQASQYIEMFGKSGFEIIELERETCGITALKVHDDWQNFSEEDKCTTILTVVCRKP